MAALSSKDRKIAPPSTRFSDADQSKIALQPKAPKKSFDKIYLPQQMEAHQAAWSLQMGYATDPTDVSLRQVATTAVPIVEGRLSMLKSMTADGM